MDSITHILLGAATGHVLLGKSLGKRALVYGAIAHSLPDIDSIPALWLQPSVSLVVHRGITHSILFCILIAWLLAWLAKLYDRAKQVTLGRWFLFFLVALVLHIGIDSLNAYGVGWLEPFSSIRVSFNTIYVVDAVLLLILTVCMAFLLGSKSLTHQNRSAWLALILTAGYLFYATYNKALTEAAVRTILAQDEIRYTRLLTTPTPLNTWLWFVVVEDEEGFLIAHRSCFDRQRTLAFQHIERRDDLVARAPDPDVVSTLRQFSQGYYTLEQKQDTLVFNDLRFGQITGWHNAENPFVFHYYLNLPDANRTVMQRGRFANWNPTTFRSLVKRIEGD